MRRAILFIKHLLWLTVVFTLYVNNAHAESRGGSSDIKILGDHILIPITFKTEGLTKDSHIIVDYSNPEAFGLHKGVADSLNGRIGKNETTLKVTSNTIHFEVPLDGGFVVKQPGETPMDDLTGRYDIELNNIDIAGIIGYPMLKDFAMKLNMVDKTIKFTKSTLNHASDVKDSASTYITGLKTLQDNTYIPVSVDGKEVGTLEFNTTGYHTTLSNDADRLFNKKHDFKLGKGDVTAKLSGIAAIRTLDFPELEKKFAPPTKQGEEPTLYYTEQVDNKRILKSGLSLWNAYEVEIDTKVGYLALTQIKDSNYSDADAEFYAASTAKSWELLRDYIVNNMEDRNVEEAVGELFTIGLDNDASQQDLFWAVETGNKAQKLRVQAPYVFGFAFQANNKKYNEKYNDLVIRLTEYALTFIGRAQNPGQREDMQNVLGAAYLAKGDAKSAWKYYLAASFNGNPQKEAGTRMGLANAYYAMGRYRRAYSNYLRVAKLIPEQFHEQAGLAKPMADTRAKLDPNDPLLEQK